MTWILTVDQHAGKLLCLSTGEDHHVRFEESGEITNTHEPHEHGRPSPKKGKGSHQNVPWSHDEEELRKRYARDVATWLASEVDKQAIMRVVVFAPAHLLGALRREWSPELARRVEEHVGDLSHLSLRELAHHPVIEHHLQQNEL